jgi:hypothetical protein
MIDKKKIISQNAGFIPNFVFVSILQGSVSLPHWREWGVASPRWSSMRSLRVCPNALPAGWVSLDILFLLLSMAMLPSSFLGRQRFLR